MSANASDTKRANATIANCGRILEIERVDKDWNAVRLEFEYSSAAVMRVLLINMMRAYREARRLYI